MIYDFVIVGGGIVGLSVGVALSERFADSSILLLEKEDCLARHQTGHNSGVIHSGIYYKPGSLKARFAVEGSKLIPRFCEQHHIPFEVCGKIIVATEPSQLALLDNLYQRGFANGIAVRKLSAEQIREYEPHCSGIEAIHVPSSGIVDYRQVARAFAKIIETRGGELRLGFKVWGITKSGSGQIVHSDRGEFEARFLINCAGLHSDRVARLDGVDPQAKIVPFRGEYFELRPEKRYLVKNLIYPVPNPKFPFLGVHFTRMTDGSIHCGPNAVLALKREGYSWRDISVRDLAETLTYGGFWKLALRNFKDGTKEMYRSFSKSAFTQSLQRLVPEVQEDDLIPSTSGVRAQALLDDGRLVDDFLIVQGQNSLHVCNAPSPAATASIPIGRAVAQMIPQPVRRTQVAVSCS